MRTRSASSVVMSLVGVVGLSALTVVAAPGVSQAAKVKPPPPYYLSLGDSYSVGYQPGLGATAGYTAVVAQKEKMQLENFGCGGATSDSLLTAIGCVESGYGPVAATDAVAYPTETQEQAALDFIAANPGKVGLITVSIGGNDITSCVNAGDNSAITACVLANAATVEANVLTLGTALRSALNASDDPAAAIVGLTYPDVILGDYVFPAGSPNPTLAQLSVTAFKDIVNPDLDAAYTNSAVDGTFVDVTKATDGYKALKHLVTLAPYGLIPEPVAKVCELTYYCTLGNIHANTTGYDFIGKLAAKAAKKDHAA
jgi:lysophospholipase L1-like esterase